MSAEVWSAEDTTPAEIEAALRELLMAHQADGHTDAPARVLNLVMVVDREWRGEIENRLEKVGRYHASRTVMCTVEAGRRTIDARATILSDDDGAGDHPLPLREHVVVTVGERHLPRLDRIVDPLVVTDLPTVLWAPHGHGEGVDALMRLTQVVLLDSVAEPDVEEGLGRARELADRAYIVDLAWLRSTPWRERVAGAFDPPRLREQLDGISSLTIRHHPESAAAALLFCGWLASRLGWRTSALTAHSDEMSGKLRSRRGEVKLELKADHELSVPGLAGVVIETSQGTALSLDRGAGGLRASRRDRGGDEREWTVMGASRGEYGILGEGIRQSMLRDPTYRPALDAAVELVR